MTTQENYRCRPDSDHPTKPLLGPSQPQEYPYWAVKGPTGIITDFRIITDSMQETCSQFLSRPRLEEGEREKKGQS